MEKVICVVGPTACGKTRLGVLLAQKYGGEVVSCDSMQIYRGMAIGTAAATPDEMEGFPTYAAWQTGGELVRCPIRGGGHAGGG